MPARLVPLTPGLSPSIPLERPVVLIGRMADCDAQIRHPRVSRRHCCVAQVGESLVMRDLGSTNGVRINGYTIEEAAIEAGDEVAVGPILFRVDIPARAPAPPGALDLPSDLDENSDLVSID